MRISHIGKRNIGIGAAKGERELASKEKLGKQHHKAAEARSTNKSGKKRKKTHQHHKQYSVELVNIVYSYHTYVDANSTIMTYLFCWCCRQNCFIEQSMSCNSDDSNFQLIATMHIDSIKKQQNTNFLQKSTRIGQNKLSQMPNAPRIRYTLTLNLIKCSMLQF